MQSGLRALGYTGAIKSKGNPALKTLLRARLDAYAATKKAEMAAKFAAAGKSGAGATDGIAPMDVDPQPVANLQPQPMMGPRSRSSSPT